MFKHITVKEARWRDSVGRSCCEGQENYYTLWKDGKELDTPTAYSVEDALRVYLEDVLGYVVEIEYEEEQV